MFNPFKPNLLASGGDQVLIHNLDVDIANPEVVLPGENSPHKESPITSVSWNQKVLHILASASENSTIVVWDLKINKPIFDFTNSIDNIARKNALSWDPEIPTQLCVTNDNANNPELQVWDLRSPQSPVSTFEQGHQDGLVTCSWCISDPSLILTGSRDGKAICWSYNNYKSQQVCEINTEKPVKQVAFGKRLPGIFSVAEEQGDIKIYRIGGDDKLTDYAPKWL